MTFRGYRLNVHPYPYLETFNKNSLAVPRIYRVMETACPLHFGRKVRWYIIGFSMVCGAVGEGFLG